MSLLYCSLCDKLSPEACSKCETFPYVKSNVSSYIETINETKKILTDPKSKFPTTKNLSLSGPLYPDN